MTPQAAPARPSALRSRAMAILAGLLIAAAAWLAYRNSYSGPFVFDDTLGLARNPSIRSLWPLSGPLNPQADTSLSGRPFANLTFAVNYKLGGLDVTGYHELNLLIHALAGLTLFGIVRRTLERVGTGSMKKVGTGVPPVRAAREPMADADGRDARPCLLAFLVALLWTLHPLQTESVTYLVQRVESLMGLLYFLTLYCFIRGAAGDEGGRAGNASLVWFGLSWLACLLGMATKEVMVSAPVIVLLYDRAFVGGSFARALARRWPLYVGLAATWILVGWLAFGTHGRNGTSGFGVGVNTWDYYLTQFPAVVRYLQLSLWPGKLILDYGTQWVAHAASVIPDAMVVIALAAASAWALARNSSLGFLGAWFFAILAPTSLIPGNRQTMAEHRMYLALAPVLALLVLGLDRLCSRIFPAGGRVQAERATWVAGLAVAAIFGGITARRNDDYRTNLAIWEDTVAKNPGNPYSRNNLANVYIANNRLDDALAQYREVVRLKPDYAEGHNNFGTALMKKGKMAEALAQFHEALRLKADYPDLQNNIGVALIETDVPAAIAEFQGLLREQPDYAAGHFNLGNALGRAGRLPEAVAQYEETLRLGMDIPQVRNNLGIALDGLKRVKEAEAQFVAALQLDPNFSEAYANLGNALLKAGEPREAIHEYESALRLRPAYADAHFNLANALALTGSLADAEAEYGAALRLRPGYAAAHMNLGNVLFQDGQLDAAAEQYYEAIQLQPENSQAQNNLGAVLLKQGKLEAAQWRFEEALRLRPGFATASENLKRVNVRIRQAEHP